jgi:hypothetical protein
MISPWQWLFATLAGVLVAAAVVATTSIGRASSHPLSQLPPNFRLGERDLLQDSSIVPRRVFVFDRQRPTAAAAVADMPLQQSQSEGVGLPGDGVVITDASLCRPEGCPTGRSSVCDSAKTPLPASGVMLNRQSTLLSNFLQRLQGA